MKSKTMIERIPFPEMTRWDDDVNMENTETIRVDSIQQSICALENGSIDYYDLEERRIEYHDDFDKEIRGDYYEG